MVPQPILAATLATLCSSAWSQDIDKALRIICPDGRVSRSRDGTATGCQSCPAGTVGYPGEKWKLRRALIGHFTSPGVWNLLLSGIGCEPHSLHWGGTYIFDIVTGHPRLVTYQGGLITEHCRRLRFKDGCNFLVCRDGDGDQGVVWSYVYQVAFDGKAIAQTTPIFETQDSTGTCGEEYSEGRMNQVAVESSTIRAISYPDINHDGFPDIFIIATRGEGQLTGAERRACNPRLYPDEKGNAWAGLSKRLAKAYRLDFLFDGKRFAVAPSSRTTF
jgi:hypothetical protein